MKIQTKILVVISLFFGIWIVGQTNCFGATPATDEQLLQYVKDNSFDEYYDSCFILRKDEYAYAYVYQIYIYNHNSFVFACPNSSGSSTLFYMALNLDNNKEYKYATLYFYKSNNKFEYAPLNTHNYSGDQTSGYYLFQPTSAFATSNGSVVSNVTIYNCDTYYKDGTIMPDKSFLNGVYHEVEPEVDKLNLFELNLTDLDYDNQVHQFNLATYTNSVSYNEIMGYYNQNYPYAIFVTDYTRVLTYDNENNKSLQKGAYLLSGYVDFLIDDKAFFYYSNYHNRIMSRSGSFFDKDPSAYKVRFSFKAVYSEDTSDPSYIEWRSSNGDLLYTTLLDDFDHIYFVGSNYTIYYAEEKRNGNFKDLTSDVRKLGYLNKREGGHVLDASLMEERSYFIHNFNFSGGVTYNQYMSSPTYEQDRLDLISQIYSDQGISDVKQDGSNGNSFIFSDNIRDSQFNQGDVTDDMTNDEAENFTGNIFGPMHNKDSDDSNWGILDYLSYFFNLFKGSKDEVDKVSSDITSSVSTVKDKFSFSNNIINNANDIKDYITNTQETHKYYLNINHKYLSGNVCIIDLSWYEPYKPTVDAFICAFAYLAFIWHMFLNIPNLISGSSIGAYSSEISLNYMYDKAGSTYLPGRNSNIHNRRIL